MKRFVAAVAGTVFLSGVALFAQDAKKIADGKKLYDSKECVKCHMIAGKGNKIGPLDGVGTKLTEADIRKWLTAPVEMEAKLDHKPKVKMSSKKIALKDPEVDALVAYMMSLKK
jgi:mono/diheme cytochrome c family protein